MPKGRKETADERKKRKEFTAEVGAAVLERLQSEGRAGDLLEFPEKLVLSYNPMYCEHIMERGVAGWSINEIAIELRVHPNTLLKWRDQYPEFAEAYAFAKKARLAAFERHYRAIGFGEIKASGSIVAGYCGRHDPEEYGDPNKVTVDVKGDGLDAIVAAMGAAPFSLAMANPPIDAEFEHVD